MKINFNRFLKRLFLFTLVLAIPGVLMAYMLPEKYITPTLPFLYTFFFASTLIVHYLLMQVTLKKISSFINYFMLLTFGKLIFFLSIVMAYALLRREDAVPFIVTFFILYLFFTVFEVIQSLSLTKAIREFQKGKEVNEDPSTFTQNGNRE
jgi:hypothetical protein